LINAKFKLDHASLPRLIDEDGFDSDTVLMMLEMTEGNFELTKKLLEAGREEEGRKKRNANGGEKLNESEGGNLLRDGEESKSEGENNNYREFRTVPSYTFPKTKQISDWKSQNRFQNNMADVWRVVTPTGGKCGDVSIQYAAARPCNLTADQIQFGAGSRDAVPAVAARPCTFTADQIIFGAGTRDADPLPAGAVRPCNFTADQIVFGAGSKGDDKDITLNTATLQSPNSSDSGGTHSHINGFEFQQKPWEGDPWAAEDVAEIGRINALLKSTAAESPKDLANSIEASHYVGGLPLNRPLCTLMNSIIDKNRGVASERSKSSVMTGRDSEPAIASEKDERPGYLPLNLPVPVSLPLPSPCLTSPGDTTIAVNRQNALAEAIRERENAGVQVQNEQGNNPESDEVNERLKVAKVLDRKCSDVKVFDTESESMSEPEGEENASGEKKAENASAGSRSGSGILKKGFLRRVYCGCRSQKVRG
jgi:hypothetical protein